MRTLWVVPVVSSEEDTHMALVLSYLLPLWFVFYFCPVSPALVVQASGGTQGGPSGVCCQRRSPLALRGGRLRVSWVVLDRRQLRLRRLRCRSQVLGGDNMNTVQLVNLAKSKLQRQPFKYSCLPGFSGKYQIFVSNFSLCDGRLVSEGG